MEDPMAQLRVAMGNMDGALITQRMCMSARFILCIVEAIKNFRFQPEKEDYLVPVDIPVTTSQMEVDVDLSLLSGPATGSQDQHKMKSNLRVFPPPLFSRQGISLNYKSVYLSTALVWLLTYCTSFKANSASVPITTVDEKTGEEKTRLINRMRWKGLSPVSISYHDEGVSIYRQWHTSDSTQPS